MVSVVLDYQNKTKTSVSKELIKSVFESRLRKQGKSGIFEISLILCGNNKIRSLNKQFRNLDKPTDVLSFGQAKITQNPEKAVFLGDIIISVDKVKSQAKDYGVSFDDEITRLLDHGLKHLLGIHHKE